MNTEKLIPEQPRPTPEEQEKRMERVAYFEKNDCPLFPQDKPLDAKELGFVGAMLSGHYKDMPYDDQFYLPIFEKAQELDVPVYLHPGMVRKDVVSAYYKGVWDQRTTFLLSGFGIGWHYDSDEDREKIAHGNAEKLLHLTARR